MPLTNAIAFDYGESPPMVRRVPRLTVPGPPDPGHRPLLEVLDLDARPEWSRGCAALIALIREFDLQSTQTNPLGEQLAQWQCGGMLISVELGYGAPVIVLESDQRRTMILLADAEIETLRAESRSFSL
jgi:hypothetical protein